MPQHPNYANTPVKDLQKLYQLLSDLEGYGFVHEDIHQYLDEVMTELYLDATKRYFKEEEEIVDEEDYYVPSAHSIFRHVSDNDKPQFIQDFRNVIGYCLNSQTWSTQGVADEIRDMRDIEYYRQNVVVIEDTETLEKYRFARKTVWFPSDIEPTRKGCYEVSNDQNEPRHSGFAYWDGKSWFLKKILLKDCVQQPKTKANKNFFGYCWRGFIEEQRNN